jgi:hypothetical protein
MPIGYETTTNEIPMSRTSKTVGGIEVNYAPSELVCESDPEETYGVSIQVICNPNA